MSRVAYSAAKDVFIEDVKRNRFIPKMREGARLNHIGGGDSEIRSWQSNAPSVRNLLELSQIPDDIIVSFEYKVPNGGRIDCMLYGEGNNGLKKVIGGKEKSYTLRTPLSAWGIASADDEGTGENGSGNTSEGGTNTGGDNSGDNVGDGSTDEDDGLNKD